MNVVVKIIFKFRIVFDELECCERKVLFAEDVLAERVVQGVQAAEGTSLGLEEYATAVGWTREVFLVLFCSASVAVFYMGQCESWWHVSMLLWQGRRSIGVGSGEIAAA